MRRLSVLLAAAAVPLHAQTFPLPASAGDTTPVENTAPFVIPMRMTQAKITDRNTMIGLGLPSSLSQWDMIAFDPSSRYICTTAEQTLGASVFRYDTGAHAATTLMLGNGTGVRSSNPATWNPANDDYSNLDPCLRTPWNTLLTAEEAEGGRMFEILNPFAPSGPFTVVWHPKIPAVIFEGIRFDANGTLYFSDEDNSGSIYKFVPTTPGDLSTGQSFVLRVDAFFNDPSAAPDRNWDSSVNRGIPRFGSAVWVPMTDAFGNPLTVANPFTFGGSVSGGRAAADELFGTPFGRCEDMDLGVLANGNEVLYSALTRENRVISIELIDATNAMVRVFVDFDSINFETGADVNPLQNDPYTLPGPGTTFNDPDNLTVDAFRAVYIAEDAQPGDIWKAIDADRDGVAEGLGLFLSLGVAGAEPSGIIFDPNDPYRCVCNVLGPSSGNSALWSFRTRPFPGSMQDVEVLTGINGNPNAHPGEFVKTIFGTNTATITMRSPGGTFAQAPFLLLLQGQATTSPVTALLPPLWINPLAPVFLAAGGNGRLLATGGATFAMLVPPGIVNYSVLVQGVVYAPGGSLVLTDCHEYVLK